MYFQVKNALNISYFIRMSNFLCYFFRRKRMGGYMYLNFRCKMSCFLKIAPIYLKTPILVLS